MPSTDLNLSPAERTRVSVEKPCPCCSAQLILRRGQYGLFWGCKRYPDCEHKEPCAEPKQVGAQDLEGVSCPKCQQGLQLKQGRFGWFISCSAYPACDYHCASDVTLASQVACPRCDEGQLVARSSRFGKSFYACNAYPQCDYTLNHAPIAQSCPECAFPILVKRQYKNQQAVACPEKSCSYREYRVELKEQEVDVSDLKLPFELITIEQAVEQLQQDRVVAYPTEAVFGLGCDPQSDQALRALLQLKQRPVEKGLILIAGEVEQLEDYVDWSLLTQAQQEKVCSSWPAPITWVVPVKQGVSALLKGAHSSIAVRVTTHPVVKALCQAFGGALVSTSANVTTQEAARTHQEMATQFAEHIDCVQGDLGDQGQPSKIYDARTGELLRT